MQRSVPTSAMPSILQRKRRYPLMSLLGKQRPQKTKEQLIEDILLGTQSLSIAKQRRISNVTKNNDDDIERSRKLKSKQCGESSKSTRSMVSGTENDRKVSRSSTSSSRSIFKSISALHNHHQVSDVTEPTATSSPIDSELSFERAEQAIATIQDESHRLVGSTRSIVHRLSKRNSDLSQSSSTGAPLPSKDLEEEKPRSNRSTRSIHRLPKRSSDSSQSNSAGVSLPPRDSNELLTVVPARNSLRGKNLVSSSAKKPRNWSRRHLKVFAASNGNKTSKDQQQEKPNSFCTISTKDTDSSFEETEENSHRPKSVPNLMAVRKRQAKAPRTLEPSSRGTRRQSRISSERKKFRSVRTGNPQNSTRKARAESPPSPTSKKTGYIMAFLGPQESPPPEGEE